MTNKSLKVDSNTNESLAQIEKTMRSMISMAQSGHFPFLKLTCSDSQEILTNVQQLSMLSPHKSKKILYQALTKCRRHSCFQTKMTIIENFPAEQKTQLIKALVTLATDQKLSEDFTIH